MSKDDGDYLASLPLMKPFNFDASNLGAAVANERAKRDEVTERRLSMCVLPEEDGSTSVVLKHGGHAAFVRRSGVALGAAGRCGAQASDDDAASSECETEKVLHLLCLNTGRGLQLFVVTSSDEIIEVCGRKSRARGQ